MCTRSSCTYAHILPALPAQKLQKVTGIISQARDSSKLYLAAGSGRQVCPKAGVVLVHRCGQAVFGGLDG